jgi:hypothetical protein
VFTPGEGQEIVCTLTNDDADIATFYVTKNFDDDNPADVGVKISCNTGLPLSNQAVISEGEHVTFVVEFAAGASCSITEDPAVTGYAASYAASIVFGVADGVSNEGGCHFSDIVGGDFACAITNTAMEATLTVNKEWLVGAESGNLLKQEASITISCNREIKNGEPTQGDWKLSGVLGDGDSLTAVVDMSDGEAVCSAQENGVMSGVEVDDRDCQQVALNAGGSAECTIVNTVFFEGIPTLNRNGLLLLALLMLVVGLGAARRYN